MFLIPIPFHRFLHPITFRQLAVDSQEQAHNHKKQNNNNDFKHESTPLLEIAAIVNGY